MVSLKLKELNSYSAFAKTIQEKAASYLNSILLGDTSAQNPAANLNVYWSYEDLEVPTEREVVKAFYMMLGLTPKTKFVNLYTKEDGVYDKNNVWLPSVSIDPDTGKLALYVGFTPVPIEYDANEGEFLIPCYEEGSNTSVMIPLDVQTKDVKTITGKEIKRATLSLTIDDDNYFEFPIRLVDNENDALARAMMGKKKASFQKVAALIPEQVAVSKIGGNDICDINRLMLPVFNTPGKFQSSVSIVPFTGWIIKSANMKYTKIHLTVDTSLLVQAYGDYKVTGFSKEEFPLSKVRKISIAPTSSAATFFVNNSPAPDEQVNMSGILIVTAPNKRVDFAPSFVVQPASALTPELAARFGVSVGLPQNGDTKRFGVSAGLTQNGDTKRFLAPADNDESEDDQSQMDGLTYEDLKY